MDRRTEISDHFIHTGAGTSMALAWVGLIPGVIPVLALTGVVVVVLVLPLLVLGAAVGVAAAPPYAAWRFIGWGRRRRRLRSRAQAPQPGPGPLSQAPGGGALPVPFSETC